MSLDTSNIAENFETLAGATVEARVFLDRVKLRTLKTDKGRVITTKELAEGLVKRADLDHAVVRGKRPKTILCADCKAIVTVARNGGPVPVRCKSCSRSDVMRSNRARKKRLRGRPTEVACADCGVSVVVSPTGGRIQKRCKEHSATGRSRDWRASNIERRRAADRARYWRAKEQNV